MGVNVGLHGVHIRRHDFHALGQLLDALQARGPRRLLPQGFDDGGRKFGRQRGFQHQHGHVRVALLQRHLEAIGRVRVDDDAMLGMAAADGRDAVGMGAAAGGESKAADGGLLLGAEHEAAGAEVLLHARTIPAQQIEDEALEVAGLGDVHRGAGGLVRVGGAARAIGAGAEELVEHVVLVGGHHQLGNRQAHLPRHMAGADVAEVAARHREADLLDIALRGLEVAGEVVDDLGQQTRPVDRVDRADAVLALEGQVVGHRLDDVLAIVKHALDGEVVDVGVLQAEHLRLLEGTHAAVGAEHEDLDTLLAAHGVLGRAAGVARRGAQDVQRLTTAAEFVLEQRAQQLHRHVLEGQGRAIGQALQRDVLAQPGQRRDCLAAEDVGRVDPARDRTQVFSRNVIDVERQDLEGEVGVGQAAPAGQRGLADLGVGLGQVQPAVGRQAFEQDVGEAALGLVAAGGDVLHEISTRFIANSCACA
mmetsp:Transcript_6754/g.28334  ORF Transcript_6754/g.28334 Transcript_6754/m.28334 type:complete len:477 (-) Transcript_6754:1036-2466(-)